VRAAIVRTLEPFGGMGAFVRPGAKVLLKPNYVMARPAERGANTHPAFIVAVAELVRECGGEPFVADSPGWGTAEGVAATTGLAEHARAMNLPVHTLGNGLRVNTPGATTRKLRIDREVRAADVVINLPKFKAHQQMLMTLAVKNLFGCVPGRRKAWIHMLSRDDHHWFGRMLVENSLAVSPALTIMDGIIAMEGRGPANGEPRNLGVVMAGIDCTAIDRVAVELTGLPWRELFTLAAAAEMGVGETDLSKIEVAGKTVAEMRCPDFAIPRLTPISFSPYRVLRGLIRNWFVQRGQRATGQADAA
jgi:uncharacterized protein (DUF362 family)